MSIIWGFPELCPFCFLTGFHNPKQTWWRRDPITCSIRPASGGTPVQPGKQTFCSPENGPTEDGRGWFFWGLEPPPFSVGGMQYWSECENIYTIIYFWMVTPLVQNKKLTRKESGDWIAIQVCWLYDDNIVEKFAMNECTVPPWANVSAENWWREDNFRCVLWLLVSGKVLFKINLSLFLIQHVFLGLWAVGWSGTRGGKWKNMEKPRSWACWHPFLPWILLSKRMPILTAIFKGSQTEKLTNPEWWLNLGGWLKFISYTTKKQRKNCCELSLVKGFRYLKWRNPVPFFWLF